MNYENKIDDLLQKHLTDIGFLFWETFKKKLEYPVWNRPTSSSGKYHQKDNGRVPSIAEHTYEMLFSGIKIMRLFGYKSKTEDTDVLLLAIVLHDSYKYGLDAVNHDHTDNKHDKIMGDKIAENRDLFKRFMSEDNSQLLEEAVRFHSGRWSTDIKKQSNFNWKDYNPVTFFVHILDMCSANNLIHLPKEEK